MTTVLFDLDDTLYPEMDFVRSGFRSVAQFLSSRYGHDAAMLYQALVDIVETDGRAHIFDKLLVRFGMDAPELVHLLVYVYRTHAPDIRLYADVVPTFTRLRSLGYQLGVITNGMGSIQRRKIAALGLEPTLDLIICCDELGADCWKPSEIPFRTALAMLGAVASDAVYVGNDEDVDFVAANQIGMRSVMIVRHETTTHSRDSTLSHYRASAVIETLDELVPIAQEVASVRRITVH